MVATSVVPSAIGFALGLSTAAVVLAAISLRTIRRLLELLHQDNLRAEGALEEADTHRVRKVEEQNESALSARLDEMERTSAKEVEK